MEKVSGSRSGWPKKTGSDRIRIRNTDTWCPKLGWLLFRKKFRRDYELTELMLQNPEIRQKFVYHKNSEFLAIIPPKHGIPRNTSVSTLHTGCSHFKLFIIKGLHYAIYLAVYVYLSFYLSIYSWWRTLPEFRKPARTRING